MWDLDTYLMDPDELRARQEDVRVCCGRVPKRFLSDPKRLLQSCADELQLCRLRKGAHERQRESSRLCLAWRCTLLSLNQITRVDGVTNTGFDMVYQNKCKQRCRVGVKYTSGDHAFVIRRLVEKISWQLVLNFPQHHEIRESIHLIKLSKTM